MSPKSPSETRSLRDQLYSQPRESITDFVFDESVVKVFEDMISRSVPGYGTLLSMLPVLGRYFVRSNTQCYDLGCSLGAATLALQQSLEADHVVIHAIDNSQAMVEQCRALISKHQRSVTVNVEHADIADTSINNASFVVMNFTLQFIPEENRNALVEKVFDGLNSGGAFLLSEKISLEDDNIQQRLTELHHMFKKANGYSDLEISQKRTALEKVLIPETVEKHEFRLKQAGFSEVFVWFQCFNFVSFLAIK